MVPDYLERGLDPTSAIAQVKNVSFTTQLDLDPATLYDETDDWTMQREVQCTMHACHVRKIPRTQQICSTLSDAAVPPAAKSGRALPRQRPTFQASCCTGLLPANQRPPLAHTKKPASCLMQKVICRAYHLELLHALPGTSADPRSS